jgi:hypothetical protein
MATAPGLHEASYSLPKDIKKVGVLINAELVGIGIL